MHIGIIFLASGFGRRFGGNKLLAHVGGKSLFTYGLENLRAAMRLAEKRGGMAQLVVVSPYEAIGDYAVSHGIAVVDNPDHEEGMAAAIRAGVRYFETHRPAGTSLEREVVGFHAYAFFVADQPLLSAESISDFLTGFTACGKSIGCMASASHVGNPAIFSADYVPDLLALRGDVGGKGILHAHQEEVWMYCVDDRQLFDVDTKGDIKKV